jgi:hypothetical protein
MTHKRESELSRCTRCGRQAGEEDKFCAQCGLFLRDAYIDQRLFLALVHEKEGRSREARQELERLLDAEPDHVLGNHILGTLTSTREHSNWPSNAIRKL